ncbi:hypothetical protein IPA_01970 [Ignicoccus pacificus DSM 13166]|uniref:Uncharacterized protein n=1 Tax=Ignicoccus pacificus DSM 13166 TaxID=940294 RepID=A0A977PKK9_9CREN|nr:hypothetical protein IPA_01970 [Ignicoccus pacificus DSM 13166]
MSIPILLDANCITYLLLGYKPKHKDWVILNTIIDEYSKSMAGYICQYLITERNPKEYDPLTSRVVEFLYDSVKMESKKRGMIIVRNNICIFRKIKALVRLSIEKIIGYERILLDPFGEDYVPHIDCKPKKGNPLSTIDKKILELATRCTYIAVTEDRGILECCNTLNIKNKCIYVRKFFTSRRMD